MTSSPGLNDPSGYYERDPEQSLAWEMTLCQCLAERQSPYLEALEQPRRYGEILASFLRERLDPGPESTVLEVGGGYGTLMAALLDSLPVGEVTLVDVSPFLLARQQEALGGRGRCTFVRRDAPEFLRATSRRWDLVISNENLGDFPTLTDLPTERVRELAHAVGQEPSLDPLGRTAAMVARYALPLPETASFHFNLGALEYLEALQGRAGAVFLAEHSADLRVPPPYDEFTSSEADGSPRRIRLRGHDEYSIRFDHLERVAQALGFRTSRFHMMDFLGLRADEGIRFMVRAPCCERAEVMHELYGHAVEYECLFLTE